MTRGRGLTQLASIGLGLALALGALAPAAPAPSRRVQVVPHNRRSFRVPFNIPAADIPRYRQVQLWVSSDGGNRWDKVDTTSPEKPFFNFTARSDGEYWFAVRTVDTQGRLYPADDIDVEPNMKVIIDTKPPTMILEARPRRGNVASVGWTLADEHLDLGTLVLEYQAEGARDWAQVPIRKRARKGGETWDAGTAEAIRVRGSVSDEAGNTKAVALSLPDGAAPSEDSAGPAEVSDPNVPPPLGTFPSNGADRAPAGSRSGPPPMPPMIGDRPAPAPSTGDHNPFRPADPGGEPPARGQAPESASPPIVVGKAQFALQYAVEDAGPNGPAAVELWVTNDGGRTWFPKGEDPDRNSPFPVDLGGEGTYGLKLVAKSAANQGDRPPVPGEAPTTIVEVDGTGPLVKIDPPKMAGSRLVITWHASDPHPAAHPVLISIRPEGADPATPWQLITPSPIDNTGQFVWTVPGNCPPKIHVRVDVKDALGNHNSADTNDLGPVLVDRSKPKSRIIGLDPSARSLR